MPTNNSDVKFVHYSRAGYNGLGTKNDNTFYVVSETDGSRALYLGLVRITDEIKNKISNGYGLIQISGGITIDADGDDVEVYGGSFMFNGYDVALMGQSGNVQLSGLLGSRTTTGSLTISNLYMFKTIYIEMNASGMTTTRLIRYEASKSWSWQETLGGIKNLAFTVYSGSINFTTLTSGMTVYIYGVK